MPSSTGTASRSDLSLDGIWETASDLSVGIVVDSAQRRFSTAILTPVGSLMVIDTAHTPVDCTPSADPSLSSVADSGSAR